MAKHGSDQFRKRHRAVGSKSAVPQHALDEDLADLAVVQLRMSPANGCEGQLADRVAHLGRHGNPRLWACLPELLDLEGEGFSGGVPGRRHARTLYLLFGQGFGRPSHASARHDLPTAGSRTELIRPGLRWAFR